MWAERAASPSFSDSCKAKTTKAPDKSGRCRRSVHSYPHDFLSGVDKWRCIFGVGSVTFCWWFPKFRGGDDLTHLWDELLCSNTWYTKRVWNVTTSPPGSKILWSCYHRRRPSLPSWCNVLVTGWFPLGGIARDRLPIPAIFGSYCLDGPLRRMVSFSWKSCAAKVALLSMNRWTFWKSVENEFSFLVSRSYYERNDPAPPKVNEASPTTASVQRTGNFLSQVCSE